MRLIFQRGHKKYLNLCSPNPFNDSEDTKYIHHLLTKDILCQRRHKIHLHIGWPNPSHASQYIKCDSFVFASENESQTLLTKLLFQPSDEQKSITNCISICEEHAGEYTKCNSTCDRQTIRCHPEQKRNINMCCPIPSYASVDTKCISTCEEQSPHLPARTHNESQHVLTKLSHVPEDRKSIETCVD